MFNRKKQPAIRSLIGEGTQIHGELRFDAGLRIDGEVLGDVVATEPSSLLVISENARVQGKVMAGHVIINGQIHGPVVATVLLELQLASGRLMLHGATVWLTGGTSRPKTPPALGVEFGRLGLETLRSLDRVLVLDGFPAGPWEAELTFGMDAVGRMP